MNCFPWMIIVLSCVIWSIPSAMAEDIVFEEYEIVRNGDFEVSHNAWLGTENFVITPLAKKDGKHGLRIEANGQAIQFLPVPTELRSATLRFDYQTQRHFSQHENPGKLLVYFGTSPVPQSDDFEREYQIEEPGEFLFSQTIDSHFFEAHHDGDPENKRKTKWINVEMQLDQTHFKALHSARESGKLVFLVISHVANDSSKDGSYLNNIDNLSLTINGTRKVPQIPGKIAYIEMSPGENTLDKDPHAINILDPSTNSVDIIWTSPRTTIFPWKDVAWSPDASEIAFVSDHECLSSVFEADIYAMKPDGSNMRKVTSGPSQEDISKGDYPRVTVKGRIHNAVDDWEASPNFLFVGVQYGTEHAVFYSGDGAVDTFTIPNVPVLGDPKTFNQPLILHFSNQICSYGIEYKPTAALVNNGIVDVGTVRFLGLSCLKMLGNYVPRDLTWTPDGSELAYRMVMGFKKVSSASSNSWDYTEVTPGSGYGCSAIQWSPVENNRYLYVKWSLSDGGSILIAEEGGEERVLVDGGVKTYIQPAWLPDGSGFVYVAEIPAPILESPAIYYYDLATGNKKRLTFMLHEIIKNVSVAPDGRHIVFEHHESNLSGNSDLWILDRENPANIWRATQRQNCISPDWSRKDVSSGTDQQPDGNTDPGDNGSGGGNGDGGGGGGCFVSSSTALN